MLVCAHCWELNPLIAVSRYASSRERESIAEGRAYSLLTFILAGPPVVAKRLSGDIPVCCCRATR